MNAKGVIKGIEEGFDDNEQIADAVEWVSDAASRLAEFEQDNHMQAIEIEKHKTTVAALQKACDQHAAHEYKLIGENEQLRLSKESAADAFCRVLAALSKASPDTITHHLSGEGACIAMVNDLRWKIDQAKAKNERLKWALGTVMKQDFRGHSVADRLQFRPLGREILEVYHSFCGVKNV